MSVQSPFPKEEPKFVSFRDLFWSGSTLVVTATVYAGVTIFLSVMFGNDEFSNSTNSEDDLESLHELIELHRTQILVVSAVLWLTVPFTMTHVYSFKLVCESLFVSIVKTSKQNSVVHYLKWLYILSFIIFIVFSECLFGILLFLLSYYDWEFVDTSNDTSYTGYYIQFMLGCAANSVAQFCSLWVGMTSLIPWILLLRSNQDIIASNDLCCFTWMCFHWFNKIFVRLLMILFVIIIIVVTYLETFDWARSGFFNVDGAVDDLGIILVFSWEIAGCWLIYLSCRAETINGIIDSENNNGEYEKLEGI